MPPIRKGCLIRMMNNSKKGVTLVELVICCVIMVLLAGACTAVVLSGQKMFLSGSRSANIQLEANALQTAIVNALPNMVKVESKTVADTKSTTEGVGIYFDGDVLTIRSAGADMTINSVNGLKCEFKRVGKSDSDTARAQFVYTATMSDGTIVSGGVVLTNTKYTDVGISAIDNLKTVGTALYFSVPVEAPGT